MSSYFLRSGSVVSPSGGENMLDHAATMKVKETEG